MSDSGPASQQGPPPVHGVLVSHGSMSAGMIDAVRKIAGDPADSLSAVSNEGRGPEELIRAVEALAGEGPTIIFTDLQSGSCTLAARFACRNPVGRRVICGTNLPMLLDFVFHRNLPIDDLVDRLIDKGQTAVRALERDGS